jgi:hypothetical protein
MTADSQAAADACAAGARSFGSDTVVRAAYEVSGAVAAGMRLKESGGIGAPSDFEQAHRDDPVVFVCILDGQFATSSAPVPGASARPTSNRARVVVSAAGDISLDAAGYHDTPGYGPGHGEIPISRPTA